MMVVLCGKKKKSFLLQRENKSWALIQMVCVDTGHQHPVLILFKCDAIQVFFYAQFNFLQQVPLIGFWYALPYHTLLSLTTEQ